jgi:hypothetical protein
MAAWLDKAIDVVGQILMFLLVLALIGGLIWFAMWYGERDQREKEECVASGGYVVEAPPNAPVPGTCEEHP